MKNYENTSFQDFLAVMATLKPNEAVSAMEPAVGYLHVTLFDTKYYGDVDDPRLAEFIVHARHIIHPAQALALEVKLFGAHSEYAVLKLDSEPIREMHRLLAVAYAEAGLVATISPYQYSPHLTLGILEDTESPPILIAPVTVDFEGTIISLSGNTLADF